MSGEVVVRPVRGSEHAALGEATVAAYRSIDGHVLSDGYAARLRDVAGRARTAEVLVAVDADGRVLGGVTFVPGPGPLAEFESDDEAGMRMLAVDPEAQGRGAGRLLAEACIERARAAGRARLVLHTTPAMTAAHRMYERLGFARTPDRDLAADSGLELRAYVLELV